MRERELEVGDVLRRQRGDRQRHAGQVDALVGADRARRRRPRSAPSRPRPPRPSGGRGRRRSGRRCPARARRRSPPARREGRRRPDDPSGAMTTSSPRVSVRGSRQVAEAELRPLEVGDERERPPAPPRRRPGPPRRARGAGLVRRARSSGGRRPCPPRPARRGARASRWPARSWRGSWCGGGLRRHDANLAGSRSSVAERRRKASNWLLARTRPARYSARAPELLLDPEQLVVLRDAVGPRRRAGLDLARHRWRRRGRRSSCPRSRRSGARSPPRSRSSGRGRSCRASRSACRSG